MNFNSLVPVGGIQPSNAFTWQPDPQVLPEQPYRDGIAQCPTGRRMKSGAMVKKPVKFSLPASVA